MKDFPHHYSVQASAGAEADVPLTAVGIPALATASPAEFGGPGDRWSPETLLVGAAADCFAITFRGVARASGLTWTALTCEVAGTLDRVDGALRFTTIDVHARLAVPDDTSDALARRVLDKAKRSCLITNSLTADVQLRTTIETRSGILDACLG